MLTERPRARSTDARTSARQRELPDSGNGTHRSRTVALQDAQLNKDDSRGMAGQPSLANESELCPALSAYRVVVTDADAPGDIAVRAPDINVVS